MAKKILVIEDDKDIRDAITLMLQNSGYDVTSSEGAKILKSLPEINPDLILLDNWLTEWRSDANGQEISKRLKTDPATQHIKIVIFSAVNNVKQIAEAGLADGYIQKPFDIDHLLKVVGNMLS
jgi:CheY-like chemotaxis protein